MISSASLRKFMANLIEQFPMRRPVSVATWGIVVWGLLWVAGDFLYSNELPLPLMQALMIPHWFLLIGTPFVAVGLLIGRVWWGITIGFVVAVILLLVPTIVR